MRKICCQLVLVVSILLANFAFSYAQEVSAAQEISPARAQDLKYGAVLYEYYQGHAFEALSALNVAKLRKSFDGHGDHPALVEGGLMLSYGMTHEAKNIFESLLVDGAQVSLTSRNQAWFYLGKVLMLEQDYHGALDALERVDLSVLQSQKPELYYEWRYLKGQLALKTAQGNTELNAQILALPKGNVWQFYLRYNQALKTLSEQEYTLAISYLNLLIRDMNKVSHADQQIQAEVNALKAQCRLSLGQLYLHQHKPEQALEVLKEISKESVFSDQALFTYSIAASQLEKFGIALEALNILKERTLFTPWLQQVPYALGYLYEQLGEQELALHAYRAAAKHYENLGKQLDKEHQEINEQKILEALSLQEKSLAQDWLTEEQIPLAIGRERVANDAYGYLKVEPDDFNYATLLAGEVFQLGLRDLHELYKLKFSLARWEQQLDSFDSMMQTRRQSRAHRIQSTQNAIQSQNAEQWITQKAAMTSRISQEVKANNSAFFMDEEQREYQEIIVGMQANLAALPGGEEKAEFSKKIKRIQAYFSWWIDDRYSINRWAAQKQLRGLARELDQFKQYHAKLKQHIVSDKVNQTFQTRIEDGRSRLATLKTELKTNLELARVNLLQLVKAELSRQRAETQDYLLAAREAQARLSDVLYLGNTRSKVSAEAASTVRDSTVTTKASQNEGEL